MAFQTPWHSIFVGYNVPGLLISDGAFMLAIVWAARYSL